MLPPINNFVYPFLQNSQSIYREFHANAHLLVNDYANSASAEAAKKNASPSIESVFVLVKESRKSRRRQFKDLRKLMGHTRTSLNKITRQINEQKAIMKIYMIEIMYADECLRHLCKSRSFDQTEDFNERYALFIKKAENGLTRYEAAKKQVDQLFSLEWKTIKTFDFVLRHMLNTFFRNKSRSF